jgi:hypothetical protein
VWTVFMSVIALRCVVVVWCGLSVVRLRVSRSSSPLLCFR